MGPGILCAHHMPHSDLGMERNSLNCMEIFIAPLSVLAVCISAWCKPILIQSKCHKFSYFIFVQHWSCHSDLSHYYCILFFHMTLFTWNIFHKTYGGFLTMIFYFTKLLQMNMVLNMFCKHVRPSEVHVVIRDD